MQVFRRYAVNMTCTQSEIVKASGVSRAAVSLAVKRGNLILDFEGKINLSAPENALWLSRHMADTTQNKTEKKQDIKPVKKPSRKKQSEKQDQLDNLSAGELAVLRIKADILERRERIRNHRIKRELALGHLIQADDVRHGIERYAQAHRINLLTIPQAISPALVALVNSGGTDSDVEKLLTDEISKAVTASLAALTI